MLVANNARMAKINFSVYSNGYANVSVTVDLQFKLREINSIANLIARGVGEDEFISV